MKIVVLGGTGQTGRLLVEALRRRGHEVVAASPSTGVDAVTGAGLDAALAGADVAVDVTNAPVQQEAAEFFRTVTANVAAAGVPHHVVLSIVGLEAGSDLPYFRAKLAQEAALVQHARGGYTIVRATQFHEFLDVLLQANTHGDEIRLAPLRIQPIALADLTPILVEVIEKDPVNGTIEVAGPEVLAADEIGRRLAAPGRRVTSDGRPFFGADIPIDALVAGPQARLGTTTLARWLEISGR